MKKTVLILLMAIGISAYATAQETKYVSIAKMGKNAFDKEKEKEKITVTVAKPELADKIKELKADGWTITDMHKNKDGSTTINGERDRRDKRDNNDKNSTPNFESEVIPDGTFVGKMLYHGKYLEIANTYKDGVLVKVGINGEEFPAEQWPECLEKFK